MRDSSTATAASSRDLRVARQHGYETSREDVLAHVPESARRILELGCSSGGLGAAIKRRQDAAILGVEIDSAYAEVAAERLDRVVVSDAATFIESTPPEAPFDCLIAADVLEHLVDPWTVLTATTSWLSTGATVIVSVPNVLYYRTLWPVLRDQRWPREDQGIFDSTHLRWFTLKDAAALVVSAGLTVQEVDLRLWADGLRREPLIKLLRRTSLRPFLAGQHIVVARKP